MEPPPLKQAQMQELAIRFAALELQGSLSSTPSSGPSSSSSNGTSGTSANQGTQEPKESRERKLPKAQGSSPRTAIPKFWFSA